jgi:hypothetical protein
MFIKLNRRTAAQVPLHLETRVCLPTNKSVTDYRCDSIEDDKRVYEKSFRFADIDFFLTDLNSHTVWRVYVRVVCVTLTFLNKTFWRFSFLVLLKIIWNDIWKLFEVGVFVWCQSLFIQSIKLQSFKIGFFCLSFLLV